MAPSDQVAGSMHRAGLFDPKRSRQDLDWDMTFWKKVTIVTIVTLKVF